MGWYIVTVKKRNTAGSHFYKRNKNKMLFKFNFSEMFLFHHTWPLIKDNTENY